MPSFGCLFINWLFQTTQNLTWALKDIFNISRWGKGELQLNVETRVKSQDVEQPEESRPNWRCLEQITVRRRINKVQFWAIEGGVWLTSNIFKLSLMKHIWYLSWWDENDSLRGRKGVLGKGSSELYSLSPSLSLSLGWGKTGHLIAS